MVVQQGVTDMPGYESTRRQQHTYAHRMVGDTDVHARMWPREPETSPERKPDPCWMFQRSLSYKALGAAEKHHPTISHIKK